MLRVQCSMVVILRFLILSLDLYFVSEVHLDSELCARGSKYPSVSLCLHRMYSLYSFLILSNPEGGPGYKYRESWS